MMNYAQTRPRRVIWQAPGAVATVKEDRGTLAVGEISRGLGSLLYKQDPKWTPQAYILFIAPPGQANTARGGCTNGKFGP